MAALPPWLEDLLTRAWSPSLPVIIITFVIAVSLPIIVHSILYRARTPKQLPTFLLVGPSGSGKTSLLTLLESQTAARPTHLSQAPSTVQASLPTGTTAASSKYRSEHDTTQRPQLLITDTPGHGKLRAAHALSTLLTPPPSLTGIIFVVDSAALPSDGSGSNAAPSPGLEDAARYLHDVLLALQRRYTRSRSSKGPSQIPVLVAANKLDLFTALPPHLVQAALEREITRVRDTRARGLLGSDVKGDEVGAEDERDVLGDGGEGPFRFAQMEEVNVPVVVKGGNVTGSEGADVDSWWSWIGEQL